MNLKFTVLLFLFLSTLLVISVLHEKLNPLRNEYNAQIRLANIQHISTKKENRERKVYVPQYTIEQASKEILFILKKSPIKVVSKVYSPQTQSTLLKIVKMIDALKERPVLMIKVVCYTKALDSTNFRISQEYADRLKAYFLKKTNVLYISAIGYGATLGTEEEKIKHDGTGCYVKMTLKKVK